VRAFLAHLDSEMRSLAKQLASATLARLARNRITDRGTELQQWGAVEPS
jgi:hypothetical protein